VKVLAVFPLDLEAFHKLKLADTKINFINSEKKDLNINALAFLFMN